MLEKLVILVKQINIGVKIVDRFDLSGLKLF